MQQCVSVLQTVSSVQVIIHEVFLKQKQADFITLVTDIDAAIMRTTYTIKGSSHFGFILQQTVSTSSHNEQKNDTTANAMARHDAKCIFLSLMHTCILVPSVL